MKQKYRIALMAATVVAILCVSSWRPASAQATRADDVLPALLVEVKGLRAALEQMASANAHAQLLVGRLQLQEGRINTMIRRLDTVRAALTQARRELEESETQIKAIEKGPAAEDGLLALAALFASGPDAQAAMQKEITRRRASVTQLAAEEAQLAQDVSTEQARWIEISQRLDELERSLAKR